MSNRKFSLLAVLSVGDASLQWFKSAVGICLTDASETCSPESAQQGRCYSVSILLKGEARFL